MKAYTVEGVKRPTTRAECKDGPRPCPWVSCRHHLLIEIARGGPKIDEAGNQRDARATTMRLNRATGELGRRPGLAASDPAELVRAWVRDAVEHLDHMRYTCALDVADDHPDGCLLSAHIAGMGDEARLQPALLVAKLILNGFDGADASIGDGLAFDGAFFFDTAHPTGSNKLALPLTSANLSTAMAMLRKQLRFDLKTNLRAKGTHLIVGVDDEENAEKIMTAEYLANAAGTATETNIKRGKFKLLVSPEIQNGEWFLADLSSPAKPVIFQNREGVSTTTVGGRSGDGASDMVGFMYDETWFGAQSRNNAGYFDFRRIVGSKP